MGVDGCWCAPRSSKPVRGVKSLSGEFDSHMLPPEPRGRVPRGFLKNVDFPLDRTEGSSYNTTVRDVSRTTSYPGVAQLVARMVRDHEAVSSNLATRTKLTKRYRCVWRKVRRINRFRAFSSPDFFSQTIDANRCFRASAPIRTGRFPVSCRCVQPAPFFSGDFSGWQRYFSQKRIIKIWASFCWS